MTAMKLVKGQLDAYNNRDLDEFCHYFADDVRVFDGRNQECLFSGMTAFRERYQVTFSNPNLHCRLLNRISQDDIVIDHEEVTGIADDVVHAIAVYKIENGRIQQVTFY